MSNNFFDELNDMNPATEEPDEKAYEAEAYVNDPYVTDVSCTPITETGEAPCFQETVRKPEKPKRKFSERPIAVAVVTAFITTMVLGGGLYASRDMIKDYILKDVNISAAPPTLNIPGATQSAQTGAELSNQQIAALISPSIVGISNMGFSMSSYLNINTLQSSGSGIIISSEGYIVTNNHVIQGANKLKVTLNDGEEVEATLVGTDATTDVAVIKIDPSGLDLKPATLGYSSTLQVGDEVFAVGNPLGLTLAGSVTHGIISALNRKLTVDGTTYNLVQTDAAINSGNSGGALVNRSGEVIGINTVKISSGGVEGLGFAIPIDDVKDIIEDLITEGYVKGRPSIGIEIVEVTPQLAYYYSLPVNYGLYVNTVVEGGSADEAGISVGDIIIEFEGEKIAASSDLINARNKFSSGDTVSVKVNREGKEKTFNLVLQEEKPSLAQ